MSTNNLTLYYTDNSKNSIIPKKRELKTWKFTSTPSNPIDWQRIEEDLNYTNPLAFVKIENEEFLLIHNSLHEKALAIGFVNYGVQRSESGLNWKAKIYLEEEKAGWIQWAKDVKRMPWPEGFQKQVNITMPSI